MAFLYYRMNASKRLSSACNIYFCFIRDPQRSAMTSLYNPSLSQVKFSLMHTNTLDKLLHANKSLQGDELFSTPNGDIMDVPNFMFNNKSVENRNRSHQSDNLDNTVYHTPKKFLSQTSNSSSSSIEQYATPNGSSASPELLPTRFAELRKSYSCTVVEHVNMSTIAEFDGDLSTVSDLARKDNVINFSSKVDSKVVKTDEVLRSSSNFEIALVNYVSKSDGIFQKLGQKSDSLLAFLTPHLKRKNANGFISQSTPKNPSPTTSLFRIPSSPIPKRHLHSLPETRTASLNSLKSGYSGVDVQQHNFQQIER